MSILTEWIQKFGLPNAPVVHVGAHEAQEASDYASGCLEPVLWFEAIPELAERARVNLMPYPGQSVVNAALWSTPGLSLKFNVSSNDGGSSSFFDFHLHAASYPGVETVSVIELRTTTLDEVFSSLAANTPAFGYLVLDVQGAELQVLQGVSNTLNTFTAIISEVSIRELYLHAPLFQDLVTWLKDRNFLLLDHSINTNIGWGDALFVRADILEGLGLSSIDSEIPQLSVKMTLPTRVRTVMIKLGINPKIFSKFILK